MEIANKCGIKFEWNSPTTKVPMTCYINGNCLKMLHQWNTPTTKIPNDMLYQWKLPENVASMEHTNH